MHVCLNCGQESEEDLGACSACSGPVVPLRYKATQFAGRVLGEKYVVLRALGRGGMGTVFLAKHRALDKYVAVKLMNLDVEDEAQTIRRFYAEAKNAARLEHPHNVKVFDFGHEEDGLAYIVMEVIRGRALADLPLPLDVGRALEIIDQVASAIAEAHQLGMVHRDIKPHNIMVTEVDGKDFVHVLDYGIAKLTDVTTSLTKSGAVVGTPEYLSPEQAKAEPVDERTDIYSLGVVFFELLTGRLPFEAANRVALALAHAGKQPPRPSDTAPVSRAVETLVLDCLQKAPADRPPSMEDVRRRIAFIRKAGLEDFEADDTAPVEHRPSAPTATRLEDAISTLDFAPTQIDPAVRTPAPSTPEPPAGRSISWVTLLPTSPARRWLLTTALVLVAAASAVLAIRALAPSGDAIEIAQPVAGTGRESGDEADGARHSGADEPSAGELPPSGAESAAADATLETPTEVADPSLRSIGPGSSSLEGSGDVQAAFASEPEGSADEQSAEEPPADSSATPDLAAAQIRDRDAEATEAVEAPAVDRSHPSPERDTDEGGAHATRHHREEDQAGSPEDDEPAESPTDERREQLERINQQLLHHTPE